MAGAESGISSVVRVSPNWSGYVATSPPRGEALSFTTVTGTWTLPTLSCARSDGGASSATWVGLGGYGSRQAKVEQIGTDANCSAAGRPVYYAWFELVPYPAYRISGRLGPGDEVSATVRIVSPFVELRLENRTRQWSVTKKVTWTEPDTSSAEWIVEAPASCVRFKCAQTSLADFGSITITEIATVGNGFSGTLSEPAWSLIALELVPRPTPPSDLDPDGSASTDSVPDSIAASRARQSPGAVAGAKPGPVSRDGAAFSIFWSRTGRLR